jgi:hypothetical protein
MIYVGFTLRADTRSMQTRETSPDCRQSAQGSQTFAEQSPHPRPRRKETVT